MTDLPPLLTRARGWLLARLLANGLLQACGLVAILLLVRLIFDSLVPHGGAVQLGRVVRLGVGLAIVALVQGGLVLRSRVDAALLGRGYAHALRLRMFEHLASLSPRVLERQSEGAILLRFTGDVAAVRRWITRGLAQGIIAVVTTVIALAVLAWLSRLLALTVALFLMAGVLLSQGPVRALRRRIRELRRARAHLMANMGEQISAASAVQAYGQGERERRRLAKHSRRVVDASVAQARTAGLLRAVNRTMATSARAAILVSGGFEVAAGRTTVGTVAAAMTVVGLLSSRARTLRRVYVYAQKARVARRKITRFLQTPALRIAAGGGRELQPGPGLLVLDDLGFEGAVEGVTAVAEAGTVVAIVGPNGAGKSTLLALVARTLDPTCGRVLLDSQELAACSLASVRRGISLVSADLPLLRGSIADNLRYRWRDAPAEELARIRELCGVDRMLEALPEGDRTRVLEGGKNLSLGQRQRVGLARALLGGPQVLLLDEVDANLDAEAALALDAVLNGFPGTVLMVSHQRERIARADAVWHLDGGRLVRVEKRSEP